MNQGSYTNFKPSYQAPQQPAPQFIPNQQRSFVPNNVANAMPFNNNNQLMGKPTAPFMPTPQN